MRTTRLLMTVFVGSALYIFVACAPQPRRSPALPQATSAGPGDSPTWSDPEHPACTFPKEADPPRIDAAEVMVRVLVANDGSPRAAQTIDEPGYGFGPAATRCAMSRRYQPATDDRGLPIQAWTPPIRIHFVR
jgi:hypothetical protein